MKITVLAVGKIKEKFFVQALEEYAKRLGRYCTLEMIAVEDEPTPDHASEKQEKQILEREGERLLARLPREAYVIALAIRGKMLDSPGLAAFMEARALEGKSQLVFVIGGSLGLSEAVMERADYALSFSLMTFPHQLMRVILLEQIYRAFRITRGEPYHK